MFSSAQLGQHQVVDEVGARCARIDGRIDAVREGRRDPRGHQAAQIPRRDGRFAGAIHGHGAPLIDAGHRALVGRELHPARDILGVAVREVRADQERLLGADGQPRGRGKHFEARHRRIALRRRRRAGRDPVGNHVILGRARREALAAAVRDGQRRLQQHQAGRRIDLVDAPRARLPRQRQVVELGVVAPQRQLEPVLSGRRAVAGAGVAAGLREHGHDVIAEAHGVRSPTHARPRSPWRCCGRRPSPSGWRGRHRPR